MEKKIVSKDILTSCLRRSKKAPKIICSIFLLVIGTFLTFGFLATSRFLLAFVFSLPMIAFGITLLCVKGKSSPSFIDLDQFYIVGMPVIKKEEDSSGDVSIFYFYFPQDVVLSVNMGSYSTTSIGDYYYVFFNNQTNQPFNAFAVNLFQLGDDLKPFLRGYVANSAS